jgi:hypothetical protein
VYITLFGFSLWLQPWLWWLPNNNTFDTIKRQHVMVAPPMNVQLASSRAFLTILLATPEAISATVATLRSFYWILVNQGQVGWGTFCRGQLLVSG